MRKIVSFRATAHQLEVLTTAEKIYQKPACKIIVEWVEQELPFRLKAALKSGATIRPFTPPIQRQRKHKPDASDPC